MSSWAIRRRSTRGAGGCRRGLEAGSRVRDQPFRTAARRGRVSSWRPHETVRCVLAGARAGRMSSWVGGQVRMPCRCRRGLEVPAGLCGNTRRLARAWRADAVVGWRACPTALEAQRTSHARRGRMWVVGWRMISRTAPSRMKSSRSADVVVGWRGFAVVIAPKRMSSWLGGHGLPASVVGWRAGSRASLFSYARGCRGLEVRKGRRGREGRCRGLEVVLRELTRRGRADVVVGRRTSMFTCRGLEVSCGMEVA